MDMEYFDPRKILESFDEIESRFRAALAAADIAVENIEGLEKYVLSFARAYAAEIAEGTAPAEIGDYLYAKISNWRYALEYPNQWGIAGIAHDDILSLDTDLSHLGYLAEDYVAQCHLLSLIPLDSPRQF